MCLTSQSAADFQRPLAQPSPGKTPWHPLTVPLPSPVLPSWRRPVSPPVAFRQRVEASCVPTISAENAKPAGIASEQRPERVSRSLTGLSQTWSGAAQAHEGPMMSKVLAHSSKILAASAGPGRLRVSGRVIPSLFIISFRVVLLSPKSSAALAWTPPACSSAFAMSSRL